MADSNTEHIVLPEQLTSSVDLARIIRELEALDESLRQAQIRKPGTPTKLSRSSITLEDVAQLNKVSLTDQKQREQLLELLRAFHIHAPRIHMSLATEPSAAFIQKIIVWLRSNIHPVVLLEVGLQPTLAAGCMVRTSNRMFDMSLRHRFTENRHLLVEKIAQIKDPTLPDPVPQESPQAAIQENQAPPAAPTSQPAQPSLSHGPILSNAENMTKTAESTQ